MITYHSGIIPPSHNRGNSGFYLIHDPKHLSNDGFMSVSFQSDRPIGLKKFQQFLDYQLPDNVFRAKGVLYFAESPKRHLFQLSGKRFTLDDSEWTTTPKNQMVLIGRKLDALFLVQSLNNCLTQS